METLYDYTMAVDVSNLDECVEDVRRSSLDEDRGPSDPDDFRTLLARVVAAREKLPPLYRAAVGEPFALRLNELGPRGFAQLLSRDPNKESDAGIMFDMAQAILQNGERFAERATDGFQEVVSDLYDGFLSAEDRRGVKSPEHGVIPPLVRWGSPEAGPYTWPGEAVKDAFDCDATVVSLPPAQTRGGLLTWATLGHETAGHDILSADEGLHEEIGNKVRAALKMAGLSRVAKYWEERIDETASDVMGVLNMGPAAGIGMLGFLMGSNAASGFEPLGTIGDEDPHPPDVMRGYLAAEVVALLEFRGAAAWSKTIVEVTKQRHTGSVKLLDASLSATEARKCARVIARTIVNKPLETLEHHSLGEIQNWRDEDEVIVRNVGASLTGGGGDSGSDDDVYAAHVVAAAVVEAISASADLKAIFKRMLAMLKRMHDSNPTWGPLFVRHRGNVRKHHFTRARNPAVTSSAG